MRVASPTYIGRERELGRVLSGLDRARVGQTAVFLVGGEAGVGKTRFLQEIAARARLSGARVLQGGCIHLGGDGLPFGPIIESLRELPDELSPLQLEELVGTGRGDLAGLIPRLRTSRDRSSQDPDPSGPGRMFEQLLLFLNRLAGLKPVVLLVEDIHWADRSTLGLLAFLVRNLRGSIVLIASYRTDELNRHHPLVPVIAEFERGGHVERLDLARLSLREVAEQIEGILGRYPDQDVVDEIYSRSDGNAFYTEELLASRSANTGVPETLREVLIERFGALGGPAQRVVEVASAAGTEIHLVLLAAVSGLDEATLEAGLREALASQILTARDRTPDTYGFRHALVQEAVYGELLPGERARLHAAFAAALSGDASVANDQSRMAELAYHWRSANDLPRAFDAFVAAGLAAERILAFAAARASYERAIELWDRVPDAATRTPLDRVELLVHTALTGTDSAPARSTTYLRRAIALVDPVSDPGRAGTLHSYLASLHWIRDEGEALTNNREAVRLVPPEPPTAARARVLTAYGALLGALDRNRESLPVLEEAIAVARNVAAQDLRVGPIEALGLDLLAPRRIESGALEYLGYVLAAIGDVDAGLAAIVRSRGIASELGLASRVNETWAAQATVLLEAGRLKEAVACGQEGGAHGERHGLVGGESGTYIRCAAADALLALGEWDAAAELLQLALQDATTTAYTIHVDVRRALINALRGDFAAAARGLERRRLAASATSNARVWPPFITAMLEIALWNGDPGAARPLVADRLRRLAEATEVWVGHEGALLALGMRAEADLAALARGTHAEPALREAIDTGTELLARMKRRADEIAANRPVYVPQADLWLATCEAEYSRLQGASDPDRWAAVAAGWFAVGMPYPRALALMREAQAVLVAPRDGSRAADAIRASLTIAGQLGARPLAGKLQALAGRAGIRVGPEPDEADRAAGRGYVHVDETSRASRRGSQDDSTARGRFALTRRELEVLDLLAAGRPDGEIASKLFISRKTVSVHVANIRGKLGAESRVEIVTIAIGLGLVAVPPGRQ